MVKNPSTEQTENLASPMGGRIMGPPPPYEIHLATPDGRDFLIRIDYETEFMKRVRAERAATHRDLSKVSYKLERSDTERVLAKDPRLLDYYANIQMAEQNSGTPQKVNEVEIHGSRLLHSSLGTVKTSAGKEKIQLTMSENIFSASKSVQIAVATHECNHAYYGHTHAGDLNNSIHDVALLLDQVRDAKTQGYEYNRLVKAFGSPEKVIEAAKQGAEYVKQVDAYLAELGIRADMDLPTLQKMIDSPNYYALVQSGLPPLPETLEEPLTRYTQSLNGLQSFLNKLGRFEEGLEREPESIRQEWGKTSDASQTVLNGMLQAHAKLLQAQELNCDQHGMQHYYAGLRELFTKVREQEEDENKYRKPERLAEQAKLEAQYGSHPSTPYRQEVLDRAQSQALEAVLGKASGKDSEGGQALTAKELVEILKVGEGKFLEAKQQGRDITLVTAEAARHFEADPAALEAAQNLVRQAKEKSGPTLKFP